MSSGSGAEKWIGSPVRGWCRSRAWAWRAWRASRTRSASGASGPSEVAEGEAVAAGVGLVGDDRVADVGQVDADLVGPAGPGLAADQGEAVEPLEDLVEGHGLLAAVVERGGWPSSRGRSGACRAASR